MTGFPDPSVTTFAHAAGIGTILKKPFGEQRLLTAIDDALHRR
jgi:AmiR/NasT family two-component response regulator